jgi:putative heme-binding domain-containing protein
MVLTQSDRNNSHMHALWVLLSANAIDGPFLQKLLASGDEATRNWGVRAVGQMGHADSATLEKLKQMARDDVPDVQAQLAISAGRIAENDGLGLLETLLMNFANANDPEIPTLIYNNLKPLAASHGKEILAFLEANPAVANAWEKSVASWIRQAINYSGRNPKEIVADLKKSFDGPTTWQRTAQSLQEVVDALTQSNTTADQRAALFDAPLRQRIEKICNGKAGSRLPACIIALWWHSSVAANAARGIVADMWSDSSTRAELVRALAESNGPENITAFNTLVRDNNTPILIRQSAVDALGSMNDKTAAKAIVDDYATMPPDLKPMAINALTHSVAAGMELMAAISAKVIDVNDVTANHARQLMGLNNKDLSKLVRDTYGAVRTERDPARVQVVEAMRKVIQSHPAGNALAGQAVFNKICTQCHTIYGHGGNVGPDLTGVGRENLDAILTNVLDPSLVIGAPYLVQDVHTKDGQVISGILVEKTDQHIILKDSTKTMTIQMSNVKRISVENISMMPEGLEKAMSQQEFVDLVAFLLTREPPK